MMRSVILSIVVSVLAAVAPSVPAPDLADSSLSGSASVSELQAAQPQKDIDVNSNANRDGGAVAWYMRPVQLALVGLVILVIVLLLTRGSGSTVGDAGFEDRIHSLDAEITEDFKEEGTKEPRSDAGSDVDQRFKDR